MLGVVVYDVERKPKVLNVLELLSNDVWMSIDSSGVFFETMRKILKIFWRKFVSIVPIDKVSV